jgi:hypothetical protein
VMSVSPFRFPGDAGRESLRRLQRAWRSGGIPAACWRPGLAVVGGALRPFRRRRCFSSGFDPPTIRCFRRCSGRSSPRVRETINGSRRGVKRPRGWEPPRPVQSYQLGCSSCGCTSKRLMTAIARRRAYRLDAFALFAHFELVAVEVEHQQSNR